MEQLEYLRNKLEHHRIRVLLRYRHYDMKNRERDRGLTIPDGLREQYRSTLGWCTKAVDAIADRLVFREFSDDNFDINGIYNMNNPDILFDSAVLSALISSCSFIYISEGEETVPRLQVVDGGNATGVIDPITGFLEVGYAVLDRNSETGHPEIEAYFEPGLTSIITRDEKGLELVEEYPNAAPYPLLVPIIHRPDAVRPFGRSRITRSAIYYQKYAKRTLERSDVTAEFYSFPQKYVLGTSQNAEPWDTWKATIASMLEFSKDEDGQKPEVGQFTSASMAPFMEQLRTAASGFAGETGLTLGDLGFETDNPASSEAIKASHESLRVATRKAQRNFGSGFLNAGFLAACVRDNASYRRSKVYKTRAKWEPIFEPDSAQLAGMGDALAKIQQAFPNYLDEDKIRDMTGF